MLVLLLCICNYSVWFILLTISVGGLVRIWKFRNEAFIQKRLLSTVLGLNTTFTLMIIAHIIEQHLYYDASDVSTLCVSWFSVIGFWAIVYFLMTRNLLLLFKLKLSHFAFKYKWQQLINKAVIDNKHKHNFYVSNESKFGNKVFVKRTFLIYCTISITICCFAIYLLSTSEDVIHYPLFFILACVWPVIMIYTVIVCKIPSFDDSFAMRWETLMQAKLMIILVMVFPTAHSIAQLSAVPNNQWDFEWVFISFPFIGIALCALVYTSTHWIIRKNMKVIGQNKEQKKNTLQITLNELLTNATALQLFMQHICRECSEECLLSLIEFNQFQHYVKEHMMQQNDDGAAAGPGGDSSVFDKVMSEHRHYVQESLSKMEIVKFPSNVPVSEIIEAAENDETDFIAVAKLKARKLFEKYVKIGSRFEINISSQNRGALYHFLENEDHLSSLNLTCADLLLLFEPAKDEIGTLLNYSLTRFRYSDEFESVNALFSPS